MGINYYKDRVCLNALAGSVENAKEIYEAAETHLEAGVLSVNYADSQSAIEDMKKYMEVLEGNLSIGLGGGNPAQWKAVADIAKEVKAHHINQIFSAVGYTRACVDNETSHINALVSPSGTPGMVKISTGPLSKDEQPAIIPVETALAMIQEMGGNAVKFFPMAGLSCKEELKVLAQACAKKQFVLEPTGGIDMDNFREIMQIILDAGVPKVIPHVYTSIIDKETGNTKPDCIRGLMSIVKELV